MDWTAEAISRLRGLWDEGHSTAEIGRRMGISKNAVVGKAHRLSLPPRPSPIRREPAAPITPERAAAEAVLREARAAAAAAARPAAQGPAPPPPRAATTPPPPQRAATTTPPPPQRAATTTPPPPPRPAAAREATPPAAPRPAPTPAVVRPFARPAPRSCCWPMGDPGAPGFRFCGAEAAPAKPYCAEHAAIAYVKARDRREDAA